MSKSKPSQELLDESVSFAQDVNIKFMHQLAKNLNNSINKDFLQNCFINTMICLATMNLHGLIEVITITIIENEEEYDLTFDYVLNDILEKIKLIQEKLKSIKTKETH